MILDVLMAFIGVISFSVILEVPKSEYLYTGLAGAIGRLALLVFINLINSEIYATLIASFVLTLASRAFSVYRRVPAIIFLRSGIFPLVPGAGIYYTAYYIFSHETGKAGVAGIDEIGRASCRERV